MAIAASSVTPTNSLEDFRIEFNNLVSDVTGITATNKFTENIIFEGATADAHETTLTVTDPTADRTITLPNETGTVFTSGGNIALGGSITKASDLTVDIEGDISLDANGGDIYLKDGGTIYGTLTNNGGNLTIKNSSAEVAAISIAGDEVVTFADDIVIKDGGTIGASSATTAITIASTGIVTFAAETISTTFEPSGDTASGDNAAIGYTAAEGLILTGQGSTSDITFKNDADTTVFTIPTGTDDILFPDDAKILVGTGSDLEIYHDGSHSYIKDSGTGDLKLQGAADIVIEDTSGANAAVFNVDAGQELYWRGGTSAGVKFATTQAGGTLTGTWEVTTALVPDASDGAALGTTSLEWSDLYLADSGVIYFGDDQDVTLTHYADNGLRLKHTATADDKPVVFVLQTGETDIAADDVLGSIRWQAPDEGTGTDAILVSAAIDAISEGDFSSSSNATKLAFRTGASETASEKMSLSSGGNLALSTDAVVLNFGADSDVNLTHVADTGLLLNSTMQLQFNDASQYISGASATKMDIRATDEIELTSTLVDVVGALTVSGTTTLNGALVLGDAAADTLTVNATLQGASPLTFEGGTADGYETTFAITDPTADRTITFPNKSMTVAGLDDATALAIALG